MIRDLTLRDLMRTGAVTRWHMVRVARVQTLAEHMYRVTILAQEVYKAVTKAGEFSERELNEITHWALEHDKPEVVNGDVPTPVKVRIKATGSKILDELDQEASPSHMSHARGVRGTMTETVVKLADLMEAVVFLKDEGRGAHTESVRRTVVKRFNEKLEEATKKYPRYDWSQVDALLTDLIHGPEYSL